MCPSLVLVEEAAQPRAPSLRRTCPAAGASGQDMSHGTRQGHQWWRQQNTIMCNRLREQVFLGGQGAAGRGGEDHWASPSSRISYRDLPYSSNKYCIVNIELFSVKVQVKLLVHWCIKHDIGKKKQILCAEVTLCHDQELSQLS